MTISEQLDVLERLVLDHVQSAAEGENTCPMKMKIIKESRPGFTRIVQFSEGHIQFAGESRPSGSRYYIVATGKGVVDLSRDFRAREDAAGAWHTGFDVLPQAESLEIARKLVEEGIAEEVG